MRIIAGIVSIAVLMWVETASAQKTYSLSVSRHNAVPELSAGEVEAILDRASKTLQKDSNHTGPNDVACNVAFKLNGPIRTFTSPAMPIVDRNNIGAVHRVDSDVGGVDFHVKLVEKITFCRPDLPPKFRAFEGCSYSPPNFRSMILVHPKLQPVANYPDHLLWPHEFGHLTGLPHRRDPSALMTPCALADTSVQVSREECDHFLSGPGAQATKPPIVCLDPPRR
jgi:hypothetical protein